MNDGVRVFCANGNSPPNQNFWTIFVPCPGPDCYEPKIETAGLVVCASPLTIDQDFNYIEDWDDCQGETEGEPGSCDAYPGWDSELRELCSEECVKISQHEDLVPTAYNCNEANWTGLSTGYWPPSNGPNCLTIVPSEIISDPDANEIDWNDFDVESNCIGCTGIGDGPWSFSPVTNSETIFGHFDSFDNSLEIAYDFPIAGGSATLVASFAVSESPPSAAINLPAQPRCNHADGYELTESDLSSTDPDNDIDGHLWIVDDLPYSHGHVMPVGVHSVSLISFDSRGARSHAGPQTIEVLTGPSCI